MRYRWLNKGGNDRLVLFFDGWGQDGRAVEHLAAFDTDVLVLYAYHDGPDFDWQNLAAYRQIDVVAWSMGVWYASLCPLGEKLNIGRAVALCGTPEAIDDLRGIPRSVFGATLAGLSPRSLEKFNIRMAGGVVAYRESPFALGGRDFDDVKDELAWWGENYRVPDGKNIWHKALVGMQDGIFPPLNQQKAWQERGVPSIGKNLPHYPFGGMVSWDELFEF